VTPWPPWVGTAGATAAGGGAVEGGCDGAGAAMSFLLFTENENHEICSPRCV